MGTTQKATQGFKPLEAHKTRWVLHPARAKSADATGRTPGTTRQPSAAKENTCNPSEPDDPAKQHWK